MRPGGVTGGGVGGLAGSNRLQPGSSASSLTTALRATQPEPGTSLTAEGFRSGIALTLSQRGRGAVRLTGAVAPRIGRGCHQAARRRHERARGRGVRVGCRPRPRPRREVLRKQRCRPGQPDLRNEAEIGEDIPPGRADANRQPGVRVAKPRHDRRIGGVDKIPGNQEEELSQVAGEVDAPAVSYGSADLPRETVTRGERQAVGDAALVRERHWYAIDGTEYLAAIGIPCSNHVVPVAVDR